MAISSPETLFDEIADFLLSQPTPEQVIAYRVSQALQSRLDELLNKNAGSGLNTDERAELEQFLQYNHVLIMLKARARLRLL
ncbi:MAG: hypothetical protein IAE80_15190 [Anaerolinea sp.]|nr:hypothetical protein [Anaerolinea sp.]